MTQQLDTAIGTRPPNDGRDWEPSCARCGGEMERHLCEYCEDGIDGHDCGEDCCSCADPEPNLPCGFCDGVGGWWACGNSEGWCEANPRPGREGTERGAIEWYTLPPPRPARPDSKRTARAKREARQRGRQ